MSLEVLEDIRVIGFFLVRSWNVNGWLYYFFSPRFMDDKSFEVTVSSIKAIAIYYISGYIL